MRVYRPNDNGIHTLSKNEELLAEKEGVFADDKEFRSFALLTRTRFQIIFHFDIDLF